MLMQYGLGTELIFTRDNSSYREQPPLLGALARFLTRIGRERFTPGLGIEPASS